MVPQLALAMVRPSAGVYDRNHRRRAPAVPSSSASRPGAPPRPAPWRAGPSPVQPVEPRPRLARRRSPRPPAGDRRPVAPAGWRARRSTAARAAGWTQMRSSGTIGQSDGNDARPRRPPQALVEDVHHRSARQPVVEVAEHDQQRIAHLRRDTPESAAPGTAARCTRRPRCAARTWTGTPATSTVAASAPRGS